MRKTTIAAVAALTSVAVLATSATAQTPGAEMSVSVTPTKAGTKKKPKASKIRLAIKNSDFTQTASGLEIWLPKQTRINTKGFKKCNLSVLSSRGLDGCPRGSRVGTGTADARAGVNRSTNPPVLPFDVTAVLTGSKSLAFYLQSTTVGIVAVAPAKIAKASGKYGYKLTVEIPEQPAQQYPPGVYNGLEKLDATLGAGKGRKALITTVGCTAKKHPFKAAITFTNNPNPPKAARVETTANAKCRK